MGLVLSGPAGPRFAAAGLAFAFAIGMSGCSQGSDPAAVAEKITRAVYADDLDSAVAPMDDATKKSVTRAEIGTISDRMHALGDFQSLAQHSAQPDSGRYEFDAKFTNGMLLVQLRIDPSGKVGAYRVVPIGSAPQPAAS